MKGWKFAKLVAQEDHSRKLHSRLIGGQPHVGIENERDPFKAFMPYIPWVLRCPSFEECLPALAQTR